MTAASIARDRGGYHAGGGTYMIRCPHPEHADQHPSCALRDGQDGRLLVTCHSRGCDRVVILRELGANRGVVRDPVQLEQDRARRQREDEDARLWALGRWERSKPASGTLVGAYHRARAIHLPMSERLHFDPELPHRSEANIFSYWPAQIALVTDARDRPIGIHRTWLRRDGSGKAPVDEAKKGAGRWKSGAVRLSPVAPELAIGEGIESTLSAMQLWSLPGWSALSAGGIRRLALPDEVRRIWIAVDRDRAGIDAAREAAQRWLREGRSVRALLPPQGFKDFNDFLAARAQRDERIAS